MLQYIGIKSIWRQIMIKLVEKAKSVRILLYIQVWLVLFNEEWFTYFPSELWGESWSQNLKIFAFYPFVLGFLGVYQHMRLRICTSVFVGPFSHSSFCLSAVRAVTLFVRAFDVVHYIMLMLWFCSIFQRKSWTKFHGYIKKNWWKRKLRKRIWESF